MDKLTTEQKAERYVQALDRAKKWLNAPNIDKMPTYGNRIIEEIFPELREELEDERIRKVLINMFKVYDIQRVGDFTDKEIIAWLKSLKDRVCCEANCTTTWKPSEKQMEALNAINVTGGISYAGQGQELIDLYNDLKKLREVSYESK